MDQELQDSIMRSDIDGVRRCLERDDLDLHALLGFYNAATLAIAFSPINIIKAIVQDPRCDILAVDGLGETAVDRAIGCGNWEAFREMLCDKRITVNTPYKGGFAALHKAVCRNDLDGVRMFLMCDGIDVNVLSPTIGYAPLHSAMALSSGPVVRALLSDNRVDIQQLTANGNSVTDFAVFHNRTDAIGMIVQREKARVIADRTRWNVCLRNAHVHIPEEIVQVKILPMITQSIFKPRTIERMKKYWSKTTYDIHIPQYKSFIDEYGIIEEFEDVDFNLPEN